ncbi:dihydroorotase [Sporosarcina obsidiansis]|uniref:dihydroorotase n=1 Tax=Sporosarcina obsidiansis TaxID=2660748 RepID=UPI00129B1EAD|nr:dihydroorotase family protein [Sporosarcina obsidiansis]
MSTLKAIKGNIVSPNQVCFDHFLLYKDGKVVSIEETVASDIEVFDASGKYVLPGAVDAHVHCYSALTEGFEAATRSAAGGGVTTIVEMPYDADKLICNEKVFTDKIQLLEKESVVDVALLATIAPENGLDQIPILSEAGACGFKISLFNTHPVRFPKIEEGVLAEAFQLTKAARRPISVHAETDSIVRKNIEKYKDQGFNNPIAHCLSRPKLAESTAALTILEMAFQLDAKAHLHHTTFPHVFELVEHYKSLGADVTAETCTHYLVFSEEDMDRLGALGKINPPLRSEQDRLGLWELLSEGEIDIVTSDHAPWPIEAKQHENIFDNSSGAPGVEVLLPILYSEGVAKGRISLNRLVQLVSENPASRFGLGHRKGKLVPGYDADFVVLDPKEESVVRAENMHSNAGWSPYEGMKLQGQIQYTFLRGQVIFDGEKVNGKKGYGEYIPAVFGGENSNATTM